MKLLIQRMAAVLAFFLLLYGAVTAAGAFLDKTDVDEKYKQFFIEEANFDVIFMGTSHTYNTLMPQEMWNRHAIPSYNWGHSNCSMPINYYVLQMVCEYTSPKLLVIDLFGLLENAEVGNGKYRPDVRDQQRVQFDAFPLSRLKVQAVKDIFDDYDDRADFLFKIAIYHNRWTEIKKDNFSPRNIPQKGAAFILGVHPLEYSEIQTATPYAPHGTGMEYLKKIIDFCRENHIRMLFTYLPFAAMQENADAAAVFEEFFKDYPDCTYLNMLDLGLIDYRTDVYTDASHLNYIGAAVLTDYLGAYIAEQYPDVVHAEDPAYRQWDTDYDEYVDYKISRFAKDAFYNNLQLLYGEDFHGEITVNESCLALFESDTTAQHLIRRLGDRISVRTAPGEEIGGFFRFSVTDNRTGETVFTAVQP